MKIRVPSFMNRFIRVSRDEDGSATIEFVILFTPMVMIMLMGVEAGVLNLRNVMLERGLDVAVRAIRLGPTNPPSHAQVKELICAQARLLGPDCTSALDVEMRSVSKTAWNVLDQAAVCTDRTEVIKPPKDNFNPAAPSELVLIRACLKASPIFPTAGLGAALEKDAKGDYAAIATAVFVNEPG